MKQITISVPDDKFDFFMRLVDALDFAQIENQDESESSLTDEQKAAWENVNAEFEEHGLEEDQPVARPIEALLNGLD